MEETQAAKDSVVAGAGAGGGRGRLGWLQSGRNNMEKELKRCSDIF